MHQPIEDYIPPPHVSYLGMAMGFGLFFVGSGMSFGGLIAGGLLGVPGGLIGAWVYHYISLAPVREDDRRRYEERKVRYAEEARQRKEVREAREQKQREYWERMHRMADRYRERQIARGEMDDGLARYLKRKAEEAAKRAETL